MEIQAHPSTAGMIVKQEVNLNAKNDKTTCKFFFSLFLRPASSLGHLIKEKHILEDVNVLIFEQESDVKAFCHW